MIARAGSLDLGDALIQEQRRGVPDLDIVEGAVEERVGADIGVKAREAGHDETPAAIERHRLALRRLALEAWVTRTLFEAEIRLALVELRLQDRQEAGVIGDQ